MTTEQNNPGTLIMIPFLLWAQPEIKLPEPLPDCWTERGGGLTEEVDSRGVPGFIYELREVCDEHQRVQKS